MTKLLLRLFVKDYTNKEDPKVRSRIGKLSGTVGILSNVLLCVGKLLAGVISGSVSVTADAMNNLTDAASSVVTLIGFRLAEKPADEDHPYGHARYEYLSGLAVAALIVVIGFELAKTSVEKILAPTAVTVSLPLVLVLVGSVAVKLWLWLFNWRLGRHIGSGTLEATAADSRNDVISTGAVLVAALVEGLTQWRIDGFMGLGVAVFILISGGKLAKETISPLLGEGASPQLRQLIVDVVKEDPKVLGYHDLMVHDYGPGQRFASLHVEMDRQEDPLECHERIDALERKCLQEHNVHLVIHYDPIVTDDETLTATREEVSRILRQIDPRLTVHDFRMVEGKHHTNLVFDIALPLDMTEQKKQIHSRLDEQLEQFGSCQYHTHITFDPEAFN